MLSRIEDTIIRDIVSLVGRIDPSANHDNADIYQQLENLWSHYEDVMLHPLNLPLYILKDVLWQPGNEQKILFLMKDDARVTSDILFISLKFFPKIALMLMEKSTILDRLNRVKLCFCLEEVTTQENITEALREKLFAMLFERIPQVLSQYDFKKYQKLSCDKVIDLQSASQLIARGLYVPTIERNPLKSVIEANKKNSDEIALMIVHYKNFLPYLQFYEANIEGEINDLVKLAIKNNCQKAALALMKVAAENKLKLLLTRQDFPSSLLVGSASDLDFVRQMIDIGCSGEVFKTDDPTGDPLNWFPVTDLDNTNGALILLTKPYLGKYEDSFRGNRSLFLIRLRQILANAFITGNQDVINKVFEVAKKQLMTTADLIGAVDVSPNSLAKFLIDYCCFTQDRSPVCNTLMILELLQTLFQYKQIDIIKSILYKSFEWSQEDIHLIIEMISDFPPDVFREEVESLLNQAVSSPSFSLAISEAIPLRNILLVVAAIYGFQDIVKRMIAHTEIQARLADNLLTDKLLFIAIRLDLAILVKELLEAAKILSKDNFTLGSLSYNLLLTCESPEIIEIILAAKVVAHTHPLTCFAVSPEIPPLFAKHNVAAPSTEMSLKFGEWLFMHCENEITDTEVNIHAARLKRLYFALTYFLLAVEEKEDPYLITLIGKCCYSILYAELFPNSVEKYGQEQLISFSELKKKHPDTYSTYIINGNSSALIKSMQANTYSIENNCARYRLLGDIDHLLMELKTKLAIAVPDLAVFRIQAKTLKAARANNLSNATSELILSNVEQYSKELLEIANLYEAQDKISDMIWSLADSASLGNQVALAKLMQAAGQTNGFAMTAKIVLASTIIQDPLFEITEKQSADAWRLIQEAKNNSDDALVCYYQILLKDVVKFGSEISVAVNSPRDRDAMLKVLKPSEHPYLFAKFQIESAVTTSFESNYAVIQSEALTTKNAPARIYLLELIDRDQATKLNQLMVLRQHIITQEVTGWLSDINKKLHQHIDQLFNQYIKDDDIASAFTFAFEISSVVPINMFDRYLIKVFDKFMEDKKYLELLLKSGGYALLSNHQSSISTETMFKFWFAQSKHEVWLIPDKERASMFYSNQTHWRQLSAIEIAKILCQQLKVDSPNVVFKDLCRDYSCAFLEKHDWQALELMATHFPFVKFLLASVKLTEDAKADYLALSQDNKFARTIYAFFYAELSPELVKYTKMWNEIRAANAYQRTLAFLEHNHNLLALFQSKLKQPADTKVTLLSRINIVRVLINCIEEEKSDEITNLNMVAFIIRKLTEDDQVAYANAQKEAKRQTQATAELLSALGVFSGRLKNFEFPKKEPDLGETNEGKKEFK